MSNTETKRVHTALQNALQQHDQTIRSLRQAIQDSLDFDVKKDAKSAIATDPAYNEANAPSNARVLRDIDDAESLLYQFGVTDEEDPSKTIGGDEPKALPAIPVRKTVAQPAQPKITDIR